MATRDGTGAAREPWEVDDQDHWPGTSFMSIATRRGSREEQILVEFKLPNQIDSPSSRLSGERGGKTPLFPRDRGCIEETQWSASASAVATARTLIISRPSLSPDRQDRSWLGGSSSRLMNLSWLVPVAEALPPSCGCP